MKEHAAEPSRLNKNAKGRQGVQIAHELLAEIRSTRESQFECRMQNLLVSEGEIINCTFSEEYRQYEGTATYNCSDESPD